MTSGTSSSFFFLLLCVTAIAAVFMATTTSNGVSATPAGPMSVQVAAGNWPTFTFNSSLEVVGGAYKMEVDFEEEFQLDSDAYRRILAQQQLQYLGNTALDKNQAVCVHSNPGYSYAKSRCFKKVNTKTPIHNCYTTFYREDCYL